MTEEQALRTAKPRARGHVSVSRVHGVFPGENASFVEKVGFFLGW